MLKLYIKRYLKRDIILMGVFALAMIAISVAFHSEYRYHQGLGDVRHKMVQCWVIWNALYTFITSFSSYRNMDSCYETVLLPISQNVKFIFTSIRVFIIVPIITALIMILLDTGMCGIFNVASNIKLHSSTVWEILTYSGYVMHRLPIMPFYLISFSTIAMCLSTISKRYMPVFIIFALILCIAITVFGPHYDFNEYNYPFIAGYVSENIKNVSPGLYFISTVSEIVSWTMMDARMQRVTTYLYLMLLPMSFLYLSYLRFKELEIDQ